MKKILVSIVNYNSGNHIRELFDYIDKVKLDTDMVDFCVIDNTGIQVQSVTNL